MVPDGWSIELLEDVAKVIDCKHRTPSYVEHGIPLISPGTIKWGPIDLVTPTKRVTQEEYESLMDHCTVDVGDLVFSRNQSTGVASYVMTDSPFVLGQDTVLIKPVNVDPTYLYYSLQSTDVQRRILKLSGGSTFSRINLGEIRKLRGNYPPIYEQKKIAKILSTWDKAIVTVEKLIANSQQQKKALMQQLLTGKKRMPGFGEEWDEYLLEELESKGWIVLSRGKVISKKDIESTPGDFPIYSSSVKNNGLMGTYGEYMFDEELISWSVDGGGNFFHRKKHKFSVTNVSGYMRLDTSHLNYAFVATQLQWLHAKYEFDYQSKAHPSVIRKLYNLKVPDIEEQKVISSVLSSADLEITLLMRQLDFLQAEKKALMQQLLTGMRRVNRVEL